jgi:hypothetical protein
MPKESVLELTSLAKRHPQLAFFEMFGLQAAIRLSLDPVRAEAQVVRRTVSVDYLAAGATESVTLTREIAWADCFPQEQCERGLDTGAPRDITEKAALVVMALLIHDIAGIEIQEVIRDSTGPDYSASVILSGEPTWVEVSGLRESDLSMARTRLGEKREQLLKNYSHGYVSVTTFSLLPTRELHSFLHGVGTPLLGAKTRKRKRR